MKYMNTIDIFSNFNIFNQVFGKKEVTAIMAIINAMQIINAIQSSMQSLSIYTMQIINVMQTIIVIQIINAMQIISAMLIINAIQSVFHFFLITWRNVEYSVNLVLYGGLGYSSCFKMDA